MFAGPPSLPGTRAGQAALSPASEIARDPGVRRGGDLLGVAATSATNVWAVGYTDGGGKTLIVHWNGTSWKWAAASCRHAPSRAGV